MRALLDGFCSAFLHNTLILRTPPFAPEELVLHDLPRPLLPAPEAARRVRLEEAEEEVLGRRGEVRGEGGADVDDAVEHVLAVLVVERRAPVHHLVEEDTEAPPGWMVGVGASVKQGHTNKRTMMQ